MPVLREPSPQDRAKYIMLAEPEKLEQLIAEQITEALRTLLERVGTPAVCSVCNKVIYWITTNNGGRRVPYSARGVPHTTDCSMANRPGKLSRWQDE